jgi:peptide-methionine (S)-S-oxide reductase
MFFGNKKTAMVSPSDALPGRSERMSIPDAHYVNGNRLAAPFPQGVALLQVAMGCFWGAERKFWTVPGVYSTAVGYAGGYTANPTYREVCSGKTGHTEVVLVAFDSQQVTVQTLLTTFWENHDPTQGMRQGADKGTQYRSALYAYGAEQLALAQASASAYQTELTAAGHGTITTEIRAAPEFFYAEEYHQQYLAKNPGGYCGIGGTGVSCPTGLADS